MKDLKPCPHCGKSNGAVEDIETTQGLKWYVFCYTCGATGGYKFTLDEAIEAWNTRASDREAELEELVIDLYANADGFRFPGWFKYYKGKFAELGIEVSNEQP